MSQKENMISSRTYDPQDPQLQQARLLARQLTQKLNTAAPEDAAAREQLLKTLFHPQGKTPALEPPFYCDYGFNIRFGSNCFINFNCTILDCAPVEIGNDVLIGPNVQIYTAVHPLQAEQRKKGLESAKAIHIDNNVWLGGGCIILPGVWIGENAVVGAGAVVTKDVPANTVAAGNPAQIIRRFFVPKVQELPTQEETEHAKESL